MRKVPPLLLAEVLLLLVPTLARRGALPRPYRDSAARRFAVLSSAAYAPNEQIGNWTFPNHACELDNFDVNITYAVPDASAYAFLGVDHVERTIVAAFQGTSDRVDWITDLSTWLHYGYECIVGDEGGGGGVSLGYIHRGFCEYYKVLAEAGMPDRLMQLAAEYPKYTITFTGHSLGGAAATVGAVDLAVRFGVDRARLQVMTFGAPRPGDSSFANLLQGSVGTAYRIVHNRDIVPHLPPCCPAWKGGCGMHRTCPYHAAAQVWYPNDMAVGQNFTTCGTAGEDTKCNLIFTLSVEDHSAYFNMIPFGSFCGEVAGVAIYGAAAAELVDEQAQLERNGVLAVAEASLRTEQGLNVGDEHMMPAAAVLR